MEAEPTRMCALLVDLPDVNVVGVELSVPRLRVHVETTGERPTCGGCGALAWSKGRLETVLVDLPCFGNPTRLVWHKRRWACPPGCESWVGQDSRITGARQVMATRAGRWATDCVV